jgi:hypothetical protein
MKMKRLLILTLLVMVSGVFGACDREAYGQVSVPQVFVDQADKAFQEVVSDRAVIDAKNQAIAAKDGEIAAKDTLIQALTEQGKLKDAQIADLAKLKCDTTSFLFVVKIKRCH